ncbi:MAG: 3-oxoacyl-ACP reductase [Anaerolineaceae bacterium]|nr:3-oxoacyl-ACP reductase [Anaerolineaceae bacterium]
MAEFRNKVVMVTGASGNLGSAVTRAFAAAGAKLALIDRHPELLEEAFPDLATSDRYFTEDADLTKQEAVTAVVNKIVDKFGRIDVLVHTVGGFFSGPPLHETPLEKLDFMLLLNAKTTFITNQAVLQKMVPQESGKIINIAARPALQGNKNMSAYSAAKAAVLRLTESAAAEVKTHGINVNAILPGTIDTPQNREAMPKANTDNWVKPESLADVILFLASEAARDIHGAAIPVYGRS